MPIRNNPCHDVVSPAGQVVNPVESNVSYANTPNRAKYLSDIIHKIVASESSEEKAQETLNTSEAPQVFPDAEKRLQHVLERLEKLSEDLYGGGSALKWVEFTVDDIIRQARGDIDESS